MIERRAFRKIETERLILRDWQESGRARDERPQPDAQSGQRSPPLENTPDHSLQPSLLYRLDAARWAELNDPNTKEETPR